MNARRGIVSALMLAGTLAASTAVGTDVEALSISDDKLNRVVVKFGDLDIATEDGVETLLRRLKRAARRVCGGYNGTPRAYVHRSRRDYRKCVKNSHTSAVNALIAKLDKRGDAALSRNELKAAKEFHRRLLAIHEGLERKEGMVASLDTLGMIATKQGDLFAAESLYQRAFALNEELGHKDRMATNLNVLGQLARKKGDLHTAEYRHRRALALHAELDHREGIANQLGKLGEIAWTRGDFDSAETFQRSALALHHEMGRKESMADNFANLGRIFSSRGEPEAAEAFHRRALGLYTEMGHKKAMSGELRRLWSLALEQNRLEDAEAYLINAVRLDSEIGAVGEAPAAGQTQLGLIRYVRGDVVKACAAWTRARDIYRAGGNGGQATRVSRIMTDSGCEAGEAYPVTAELSCKDADSASCPAKVPLPKLKPRREVSVDSGVARPVIASMKKVR